MVTDMYNLIKEAAETDDQKWHIGDITAGYQCAFFQNDCMQDLMLLMESFASLEWTSRWSFYPYEEAMGSIQSPRRSTQNICTNPSQTPDDILNVCFL